MTDDPTAAPLPLPSFPGFPFGGQDLRTMTSMGGLQEIGRTFRDVMERHDRAIDALFEDEQLKVLTGSAIKYGEKMVSIGRLRNHLKRILSYLVALGVTTQVDPNTATPDQVVQEIARLRAAYNQWRLKQSKLVTKMIREALEMFQGLRRPARQPAGATPQSPKRPS